MKQSQQFDGTRYGFGPVKLNTPSDLYKLYNAPQGVVDLLNAEDEGVQELRTELRVWVDTWLNSDIGKRGVPRPHVGKMIRNLTADRREALLAETPCAYMPTTGGRMMAVPTFNPGDGKPKTMALNLFKQLVLHPDCELVCGPCPNCKRYFLKKGKYPTKYCPDCDGSKLSARSTTLQRQRDEVMAAINLAREALAQYAQKTRRQTWQQFTLAYMKQHGHERKASSLTRWVNNASDPMKVDKGEYLKLPQEIEAAMKHNRRGHNGKR